MCHRTIPENSSIPAIIATFLIKMEVNMMMYWLMMGAVGAALQISISYVIAQLISARLK